MRFKSGKLIYYAQLLVVASLPFHFLISSYSIGLLLLLFIVSIASSSSFRNEITVSLKSNRIGSKGIKHIRWAQRFLTFANLSLADAYQRNYSYYDANELNNLFKRDVTSQTNNIITSHRSIFIERYDSNDYINKMCFTDMHYFMQGLNLTVTDRASMAASLEDRVPFIDKEVVELALAMKSILKFKNGIQKYVLKKVAEKHLPREIIYRPKASFGAPIRSWIFDALSPLEQDILTQLGKKG